MNKHTSSISRVVPSLRTTMMTPEEARRVIQSHKFVENHFIYGVAKRQANRAINEVDTNIKNHTFMNK